MPGRTLEEQLDRICREIDLYIEADRSERYRFERESLLWTASDRIEWQETRTGNTQRLRELIEERDILLKQLRSRA